MLFELLVIFVIASFIAEALFEYLNSTRRTPRLPDELKEIYDEDRYAKSIEYEKVKQRYSLLRSFVGMTIILAMLFLGGFALVDRISWTLSDTPVVTALVFFGIIMLASDIISLPFDWYGTFVIEERFGFNRSTPKLFITDRIKGWLLGLLIGGGLLALVTWFYYLTTEWFWVWALILITLFMIFMNLFYSTLIVPLFNKQTPLEPGELKEEISAMSNNTGFRLDDVFVIDGSRRSTKANAYFAGLGRKKRIVLFDTLISDLKVKEIVAVLAHEIGHYKKRHIFAGMAVSAVTTAVTLYILSVMLASPRLSVALGAVEPSFHMGLVAFGILYSPVSAAFSVAGNWLSRRNEYEADRFAARYSSARNLADALKKLTVKNLSNLRPHPLYVYVYYSHPPLLERLKALEEFRE
ncbi:MAG: M48 family peptidase [Marinilabiliales bacterium]|nr:MAG: M48 family peptidase [Marinilabiliales bacterium]